MRTTVELGMLPKEKQRNFRTSRVPAVSLNVSSCAMTYTVLNTLLTACVRTFRTTRNRMKRILLLYVYTTVLKKVTLREFTFAIITFMFAKKQVVVAVSDN